MRQVPDCLQRRYKAMDELVTGLSSSIAKQAEQGYPYPSFKDDRGIRMMCKFWNILKEDPNYDLQGAVKERMTANTRASGTVFGPRDFTCYQVGKDDPPKTPHKCGRDTCAKTLDPKSNATGTACCNREQVLKAPESLKSSTHSYGTNATTERSSPEAPISPLTQALGTMKEAASAEKKCYEKTVELMTVQEQLKVQIAQLEEREETEVELLKEADAMWTQMENEYKRKLAASHKRQEELLAEHKGIEKSAAKWRKNKKNLEDQLSNVEKCIREIREKNNKKTNDLKTIEMEMDDLKKRIDENSKEVTNASKVLDTKKNTFEKRMQKLTEESKKLIAAKAEEEKIKADKIAKGDECVKEARGDLAKLCRILLKKKLENEDLRAEAKALMDEIDLLRTTCDQCGDRCKKKEESLKSAIQKCNTEIEEFKLKCTKCHVSCDTKVLRKYCTDCPRCQEEMEPCVYGGEKCTELAMNECVCTDIKIKFMNNVFENMYTVLERQVNTRSGKAVAEQVLRCLKNSTNGKLDPATRAKLQEFILAVVKTNLNLTIIGGAVKTRCEMDPSTYKDLMRCLTKVKAEKPPKADKGTDSRKEPCARWGGPHECNCPYGPKNCICKKKAPRAPSDPTPCGQLEEDKKDIGELSTCPHKDKTPCGPLCGNTPPPKPDKIATDLAKSWKPSPCAEKSCSFSTNLKTAQYTTARTNEFQNNKNSRASSTKGQKSNVPFIVIPPDSDSDPNNKNNRASSPKGHKSNVPLIIVPSDYDCCQPACDCGREYDSCDCYGSLQSNSRYEVPSEEEFKKMFKYKHMTLPVTVLGQNGTKADMNAELTRTKSGHVVLDVRRISDIGEIANTNEEYPVSLFKTNSSYKLIVSEKNAKPNAILKRTSPGEINLILKDVCPNKKNISSPLKSQEKIVRVKLKDMKVEQSKTFLKRTPSGNYRFILDKEFEKRYKEIINDSLCDKTECFVNLSKTGSGTHILDLSDDCQYNALLAKSDSGDVKLIVKDLDYSKVKKHNTSFKKARPGFENLFKQLCSTSALIQNNPYSKQKEMERKLEYGLLLDENLRLKIIDQQHFVAEFWVSLNKKKIGLYLLLFNHGAEASFMGSLLTSYLGVLPIYKISERNLVVYLNSCNDTKNRFGWLKMSFDGNIVLVVDSKVTKGVQNDAHSAGLQNSGISTSCHKKIDNCDCDTSKCCCDDISLEWLNWKF